MLEDERQTLVKVGRNTLTLFKFSTTCQPSKHTLFQVTSRGRSTTATSYRARCCCPGDAMTDYDDGALWRYFEHLKFFFELLDLTLGVSVCSDGWTRTVTRKKKGRNQS